MSTSKLWVEGIEGIQQTALSLDYCYTEDCHFALSKIQKVKSKSKTHNQRCIKATKPAIG